MFYKSFQLLIFLFLMAVTSITSARSLPGSLSPKEKGDGPPITVWAETYEKRPTLSRGAFTALADYVLPSPNQDEAGSCLYMAHTGNVEWWLNKLKGKRNPVSEGPTDLSERYTMLLSSSPAAAKISNSLTDTVYLFNMNGQKAYLNRSYRYTKGWVKSTDHGFVKARPNERGAEYSTSYNWVLEPPSPQALSVGLPRFEREVIYQDPEDNRWAINSMPSNIVETIKAKLRERNAPVLVVYNHMLIWHAVMIVGYDDNESTEGCKFTSKFISYTKEMSDEAAQKGDKANAQFYLSQSRAVQKAQLAEGGCQEKGVLLVRDSIYEWPEGPTYDYDLTQTGEETSYSAPIVKKEYQWLKRFGNHAIQIYVAAPN